MENYKIRFDDTHIYLQQNGAAEQSMPLAWFPRLQKASKHQRNNYEFSPYGIHWPELDEDLSFEGFLKYDKDEAKV